MAETRATVVREGFQYLEGARWHAGRLWFSDIPQGKVYRLDPGGDLEVMASLDGQPSGLGFLPDGGVLVVTHHDNKLRRLTEDGGTDIVTDLDGVAVRANDLWVDADGRSYVTQIGFELSSEGHPTSQVVVVQPNGDVETFGDLLCPNGVQLTPDGKTLMVSETFLARVSAFDVDSNGRLSNQRVFTQFDSPQTDLTDGLCIDEAGGVWVTCTFSSEVRRVVEGGEVTDVVKVATDGHLPVSCALGGRDGRTLYMCVAATDLEGIANNFQGTARIEAVAVDIPGIAS